MSDFAGNWRSSLNVQTPRADALRRNWLDEISFGSDAYRTRNGLSPINEATRSSALQQYAPELPVYGQGSDYFNQGRPEMAPNQMAPLQPLGQLGFRQQADDAAFASQIGGLLQGQGAPSSNPYDQFETALSAQPLARLGIMSRTR